MSSELTNDLLPSEQARFDEVCRFGHDNREQIARAVAHSFADDPLWKWIYDTTTPVDFDVSIVFARMLVAESAPADEIHGFRDFGAVALWTAPAPARTEEMKAASAQRMKPHLKLFLEQIGERASRTGELGTVMDQVRPEEPHWYLGILGTEPERQSQGLGSRLLEAMHTRCDRVGVPSFLVSSNPRNYGFYRRHGYVEVEEFTAADSPPLLGFWRAARAS